MLDTLQPPDYGRHLKQTCVAGARRDGRFLSPLRTDILSTYLPPVELRGINSGK
jgi:hypothetical protein